MEHGFGYIDIRKQDENPQWVVMKDAVQLANTTHDSSDRRKIFL